MSKPSAKPKAYSYVRFSSPEQSKGDSLRRQAGLAEDYARRHGLQLDTELTLQDLGVSAYRGDNLATGALGAFLEAVTKGLVPKGSFLLVESLDRVSRKAASRAANVLQSICYAGIKVVTLTDGRVYDEATLDDDPVSFIYAVLVFMRAHEESLTKSKRLKAAWHGKRLKVREQTMTAITPGWVALDAHRKPTLIPERAKIVRRIVKDYLAGEGKDSIARALNEEGHPCWGTGKRRAQYWHRSYIHKLLNSPALVGTFVPHMEDHRDGTIKRIPQEPVTDYFPAVIDHDTHQRLQSLLNRSPLRGRHAKAELRNVLSGLARCPLCDGAMIRATKVSVSKGGYPFLVCSRAKQGAGCEYRSVRYDVVEAALLKDYAHALRDMPHPDEKADAVLRSAQAAVDELASQVAGLLDILQRKPSDALAARVVSLEVQLKEAEGALQEASKHAADTESRAVTMRADELGVAMRARPLDLRRINASLRAMLDRVTVNYPYGTLDFHWKAGGESSLRYSFPRE